jgi:hypothetical protein
MSTSRATSPSRSPSNSARPTSDPSLRGASRLRSGEFDAIIEPAPDHDLEWGFDAHSDQGVVRARYSRPELGIMLAADKNPVTVNY